MFKKVPNRFYSMEELAEMIQDADTDQMHHSIKVLTKGNLWPYILSLMKKEGKVYAYNLDKSVESRFGFKPSKIMLYLVLYSLEENGLVTSSYINRRKYYRITKKGIRELNRFKKLLKIISDKL